MGNRILVVLIALLVGMASSVRAATMASYPFTSGSADSIDTYASSAASSVTDVKTYIGISATNHNAFILAYDGASPNFSTNFSDAVNNDRYLQFSITAGVNRLLILNTLSFNYGGSAGSSSSFDATLQIRSSADNFVNPLGTTPRHVVTNSMSPTNTSSFYQLDLSNIGGVQNQTAITFRIYGSFTNRVGFASDQNLSIRIDNLVLDGAASGLLALDTLAFYPFTLGNLSSGDTNLLSTATAVSSPKTYITASGANNNLYILAYDGSTPVFSTNFTEAVDNARYAEFTITADTDLVLALEELSFDYGGGTGSSSSFDAIFQVRSSVNGYATPLGTTPSVSIPSSSAATYTPGSYTLNLAQLSSIQSQSSITFRVYGAFLNPSGFTPAQAISLRIDNLRVRGAPVDSGSVNLVIPAYGTWGLLALGLLVAWAAWRRVACTAQA